MLCRDPYHQPELTLSLFNLTLYMSYNTVICVIKCNLFIALIGCIGVNKTQKS